MSGQVDGSCFGKPNAPETATQDVKDIKKKAAAQDNDEDVPKVGPPAMPSFLKLTEQGECL